MLCHIDRHIRIGLKKRARPVHFLILDQERVRHITGFQCPDRNLIAFRNEKARLWFIKTGQLYFIQFDEDLQFFPCKIVNFDLHAKNLL